MMLPPALFVCRSKAAAFRYGFLLRNYFVLQDFVVSAILTRYFGNQNFPFLLKKTLRPAIIFCQELIL
jgi:hypothetical protein